VAYGIFYGGDKRMDFAHSCVVLLIVVLPQQSTHSIVLK